MAETKQVPVAVPETMLAVRVRGPNDIFLDPAAPVPTVRPGYLLIRVLSVALNPSDHKRSALFDDEVPHTIGCDAAGVVVSCGEHLGQDYRPGDRVAGLCYGMKPGDATSGAFGQYALLRGTLSMRIPDHVSDAEAATLPVGLNFAGQALYQTLGLPLPVPVPDTSSSPDDDAGQRAGPSVLVYGGATATGMMALQLARLSGCRVLAACSPRNAQLVRALGAHDVFDYRAGADACAAAVRAAAGGGLLYALDCVAAGDSLRICAGALSPRPGVARYAASLPVGGRFPRSDVEAGWTSGYDAFGEPTHLPASLRVGLQATDADKAAGFWRLASVLLKEDRIRLGPLVHLREGGLAEVPNGLLELKAGRVNAGKLVYMV